MEEENEGEETRKLRVDDEKEIMGVLLVSRVTARFLRKFERSCRRGTSRQRVQKARPTSTLIRRCSLRVRTRPFPYLSILSFSLSLFLPSSFLAHVVFLLYSCFPTFCISDAVSGHGRTMRAKGEVTRNIFLFPFVRPRSFFFFDSSCGLQVSRCSSVKFFHVIIIYRRDYTTKLYGEIFHVIILCKG